MSCLWNVTYDSPGSLRSHLEEHEQRGVIFLAGALARVPEAFERVTLQVRAGSQQYRIDAEVIQVLTNAGYVMRLLDTDRLDKASLGAAVPASPAPTLASADEQATEQLGEGPDQSTTPNVDTLPRGPAPAVGSSVVAWPIEKLQAGWDELSLADKIRVARHGKRAARAIILRGGDRTLLAHVLNNPSLAPEEVAVLAASPLLDPSLLRRIAANREWLRAAEVTRNLICNPKLPLPEVERLLRFLSAEEMQRLAKSGRVRASVRAVIAKRVGAKG
jgi:hypothetical protein